MVCDKFDRTRTLGSEGVSATWNTDATNSPLTDYWQEQTENATGTDSSRAPCHKSTSTTAHRALAADHPRLRASSLPHPGPRYGTNHRNTVRKFTPIALTTEGLSPACTHATARLPIPVRVSRSNLSPVGIHSVDSIARSRSVTYATRSGSGSASASNCICMNAWASRLKRSDSSAPRSRGSVSTESPP